DDRVPRVGGERDELAEIVVVHHRQLAHAVHDRRGLVHIAHPAAAVPVLVGAEVLHIGFAHPGDVGGVVAAGRRAVDVDEAAVLQEGVHLEVGVTALVRPPGRGEIGPGLAVVGGGGQAGEVGGPFAGRVPGLD